MASAEVAAPAFSLTEVTPIRRTSVGYPDIFRFELAFDDGTLVYVDAATLTSYRRVQREVLADSGRLFIYPPAERRGGRAAWMEHLAELSRPEATVPLCWSRLGGAVGLVDLEATRRARRAAG